MSTSDQRTAGTDLEKIPGKELKQSSEGIIFIPRPSDSSYNPLNWPTRRKLLVTFTWCLGTFVSAASGLGNVLGYFVQASVYGVPANNLSYSVVAATAGIAVGPFVTVPLSGRYGKSFVFFWSLVGLLATGIWSACMTAADQYIPFVIARLCGGFFGGNATALGATTITDIYFLHQRGKALTILNLSFLLGIVVGPTFSGFIVASAPWPVEFWWSNALELIVLVLTLTTLPATEFERDSNAGEPPRISYLESRNRVLFWGSLAKPQQQWSQTWTDFMTPFRIGISPVTLVIGLFTFVDFGFSVFFNVILTVFLQNPVSAGGYGFNPMQNAVFLFSLWFGIALAQMYGSLVSDRLPLWLCRRFGGKWKPEYRLHALWIPGLMVLPISLGLFGACLQNQLHFMVLAVSCFLGGFATNAIIPVTVTYIVEYFRPHGAAVGAILGLYRLTFVIVLPFFVNEWMAEVGPGWTLNTAAFLTILHSWVWYYSCGEVPRYLDFRSQAWRRAKKD